jgi:hypothetical protein
MSLSEKGMPIYKSLFRLYLKIQDSREAINYNSDNDKREEIIDDIMTKFEGVKKDIDDVGKTINDNSECLNGLMGCLQDIPAYLMDDFSVITSRNSNGLPKYDSEKSFKALLEVAHWIVENMKP